MAKDKNTLLNETTVRRFMKLAELGPMSENFLEGMPSYARDDEEEEEGLEMGAEDELVADEAPLDEPAPEEGEELELDAGLPGEELEDVAAPADPEMQAKVKEFFDSVAQAATDILGVETAVESDGETEEVAPMEEPAEMGMEEPAEMDAELDLGPEDPMEDEPEDELAEAAVEVVDDDALVQEVSRRVIKRLLKK